jgi:hypothetical protein
MSILRQVWSAKADPNSPTFSDSRLKVKLSSNPKGSVQSHGASRLTTTPRPALGCGTVTCHLGTTRASPSHPLSSTKQASVLGKWTRPPLMAVVGWTLTPITTLFSHGTPQNRLPWSPKKLPAHLCANPGSSYSALDVALVSTQGAKTHVETDSATFALASQRLLSKPSHPRSLA